MVFLLFFHYATLFINNNIIVSIYFCFTLQIRPMQFAYAFAANVIVGNICMREYRLSLIYFSIFLSYTQRLNGINWKPTTETGKVVWLWLVADVNNRTVCSSSISFIWWYGWDKHMATVSSICGRKIIGAHCRCLWMWIKQFSIIRQTYTNHYWQMNNKFRINRERTIKKPSSISLVFLLP